MNFRVVVIHNIIAPYIVPTFNHLSSFKDIDLKVIFLAEKESNRRWTLNKSEIEFEYCLLSNSHFFIRRYEMPLHLQWGLWRELESFNPDVICICGYHYFASIEVLVYAKLMKKKVTLWSGSHLLSGFIKNRFAESYKQMIISSFDTYISYGTAAKEHLIHYGAEPQKIVVGCNTVDVDYFIRESRKITDEETRNERKRFKEKNILYVGEFIERKGVLNLIKAFEKLKWADIGLILIGEGKEKPLYQRYVQNQRIKNVFFEGFIQKHEIIKYYMMADLFVLPSFNEVWGLVVNEAMACGMPILCTNRAGVAHDLVIDGVNGYTYDPERLDEFVAKLDILLQSEQKRRKMGLKSLKIIQSKTAVFYAFKIREAINLMRDLTNN